MLILRPATAIVLIGLLFTIDPVCGDDSEPERLSPIREWMQSYADGTVIRIGSKSDSPNAKLVPQPVFRYSDEERAIPDATLWVWTRDNRPVAFEKIEVNAHGGSKLWTICFASLSEELLNVQWPARPARRAYASTAPGLRFQSIPDADAPSPAARLRSLQLRRLPERFEGDLVEGGGTLKSIRIMPRPIFEYRDAETKMPIGAIFGLTATGTNPDVLLLIEARGDSDDELHWEYAAAQMTTSGAQLRLDDERCWDVPQVANSENVHPTWTFYFMSRSLSVPEG